MGCGCGKSKKKILINRKKTATVSTIKNKKCPKCKYPMVTVKRIKVSKTSIAYKCTNKFCNYVS